MAKNSSIYGLIGFPLTHSFSAQYFNRKFAAEGIDAEYVNFEIPAINEFPGLIASHPNLCGLNVTIPYKQQVIQYMDELDPDTEAIGAVNVIKFLRDGKGNLRLKGYNSDVIGFTDSIEPLINKKMKRALILGTGGASKAVAQGLRNLGITPTFVSRHPGEGVLTYSMLTPEIMEQNLIIVNTTPLGMYPHTDECPDIPYHLLTPEHLCYDLLYNPDVTKFMRLAENEGAKVKNGLEMLLLQAFAAWTIWQS